MSQANKKRVIDHVLKHEEENSPKGLSYTQKAEIATKFARANNICEELNRITVFRWFKDKEKTFEQVRADNEKDEKRLGAMKQIRPQSLIDFERKLNETLVQVKKYQCWCIQCRSRKAERNRQVGNS